jgi:hypothetical protein
MRRLVTGLLAALTLAGCAPGALIGRTDAVSKADSQSKRLNTEALKSVHHKVVDHVTRREAKLMSWPDFVKVSQIQTQASDAPPGKQKVWLVAESGDIQLGPDGAHEHWVFFVINAVTGSLMGFLPGPFDQTSGAATGPDWPSNWDQFPNVG